MLYLITYDIPDDRLREKVAQTILDHGGKRIQYSALTLQTTPTELTELINKLKKTIGKEEANILIIPLCSKDAEKTITINYKKNTEADTVI